jgi:hypothetical protein
MEQQIPDGPARVGMDDYVGKLPTPTVPADRPPGKPADEEKGKATRSVGKLSWQAREARLDLSYAISFAASAVAG